jgi:hypothetical protein
MRIRQFIRHFILKYFTRSRDEATEASSDSSFSTHELTGCEDKVESQFYDEHQIYNLQPIPPLLELPNEILSLITSYAPDDSAMSLSLTCCALYRSLGQHYLKPRKKPSDEVLRRFLSLLDRDSSTHVYCPQCIKIHSISYDDYNPRLQPVISSWSSRHWPANESLPCWEELVYTVKKEISREFSTTIFRMAMKNCRQGRDTSKLLGFLSCEKEVSDHYDYCSQRSARVKIRDGVLLFRDQNLFLIPSSSAYPVPLYAMDNTFRICGHHNFTYFESLYRAGLHIPRSDEVATHKNTHGIMCCDYCHTEFRVDFKSYGSAYNAMFVTRWLDLGDGCDPNDERWTRRMWLWEPELPQKVQFQRGSICSRFEGKPDDEFAFDAHMNIDEMLEVRSFRTRLFPKPYVSQLSFDGIERSYVVEQGRFVSTENNLDWLFTDIARSNMVEHVLK